MSDDKTPKALTGQVLSPAHGDAHLPIQRPLSGVPLLNRMRYRAVKRELEEYLSVLTTKNAVLREIGETVRIGEEYSRALARTERLDDLRRIEALKIDAEMDAALENAVEQHEVAQINALRRRARKAAAETEAIEAEQRLATLKNPPAAQPWSPPPSPAERIKAGIAKLREQEQTLIAALLAEFKSEEDAPEEIRELVRDIRFATRNRIANLIDEIGQ